MSLLPFPDDLIVCRYPCVQFRQRQGQPKRNRRTVGLCENQHLLPEPQAAVSAFYSALIKKLRTAPIRLFAARIGSFIRKSTLTGCVQARQAIRIR